MDFYTKKYTVLMNEEPVTLMIKNGKLKSSKFMDKKVALNLNEETLKQIQSAPTKIVNGNNLIDNKNFVENISKMTSQQLDLALEKNDKKVLSRFARSELIPENKKEMFLEVVNRQKGIRGLLIKAANNTNKHMQNLSTKIDNFFLRINDKLANKKVNDKYLEKYQLKQFNKAIKLKDVNLSKNIDPKLATLAKNFIDKNSIKELTDDKMSDKLLQNEFMEKALKMNFKTNDAKIALAQVVHQTQAKELYNTQVNKLSNQKVELDNMNNVIKNLQAKLDIFEKKEASKNESLDDYKTLSKGMNAVDKIDILIENKEYINMDEAQKLNFENEVFKDEINLHDKAVEVKAISKELDTPVKFETVQDRTETLNFYDKKVQADMMNKWSELQNKNKIDSSPNRDFMNISAVRFDGVSSSQLSKWADVAKKNNVDNQIVDKFIDASLRNAQALTQAGVMKEISTGEYKFVDKFSKESLYKNIDKSVDQIQTANQGKSVQIESHNKNDLKDSIQTLASHKSFDKLIGKDGEIDSESLHKFSDHLQKLSTQVRVQEKANNVTMDDINLANKGNQQSQNHEQQRA